MTACCDGHGNVHHGEGALHFITPCRDKECLARRERAWAIECGEVVPKAEVDRLKGSLTDIATAGRDVLENPATKWPLAFVTYAVDTAEGALADVA